LYAGHYFFQRLDHLVEFLDFRLAENAVIQRNKKVDACPHCAFKQQTLNPSICKKLSDSLGEGQIIVKAVFPNRSQRGFPG
jgi:hypothetical protein